MRETSIQLQSKDEKDILKTYQEINQTNINKGTQEVAGSKAVRTCTAFYVKYIRF